MQPSPLRPQHLTQFLLAVLGIGVWGLLLNQYFPLESAWAAKPASPVSTTFDTLDVQRINIVDPDGKTRLVISDSAQFPGAAYHGKSRSRSIHNVAGILFFDTQGNETGGLAFAKLRNLDMDNFTFDCTYQPTDCIRMIKFEDPNGKRWRTAFEIFDRRPYTPGRVGSTQGIERISLSDENHNAALVISDAEGHPRIHIGVGRTGKPGIEMLNSAGRVTYRAGSSGG